jgi:hypothetical protein
VRGRLPSTFPAVAGWILVVALMLMLLARLPGVFHSLNNAAKAAIGRNQLGGALATADSIRRLNDDFVIEALESVPKNASYAVVLPTESWRTRTASKEGRMYLSAVHNLRRQLS